MLHVICGAPCSGKTTYVSQHAGKGELVIDFDKIASAFGGSDYHASGEPFEVALEARKMAINRAINGNGEYWLIDTLPTSERLADYKKANADIVIMPTPIDVCLERAKERPEGTAETINKWFKHATSLFDSIGGKVMSETVNQEVATNEGANNPAPAPDRTFSQAEVDAIVRERLTRDRVKYADYDALREKAARLDELEEASKTELQKAQDRATALDKELKELRQANVLRDLRQRISTETGVPVSLLTESTEEALKAQADGILSFARPGYPVIRDGGELPTLPPAKQDTRDQFADWFAKIQS